MGAPIIIIILVLVVMACTAYKVPQQQAYIIERLGKFHEVVMAGLHFKVPFLDTVAHKTNLRVSQLDVKIETKTKDNVFVLVTASTQYRIDPNHVETAYYELQNPQAQMRSYMEDALRSAIPQLTLDDAFSKKDDVAFDVQRTVGTEMSKFGFIVVKTLVTNIDPSDEVKCSMDSINAAQRDKEAATQRAEAKRIETVTMAQAEAEKSRLQGKGQADARREVAKGIVDQFNSLRDIGMDLSEINATVMLGQYLDTSRELAKSQNSKVIILPASTPGGFDDMRNQIIQALTVSENGNADNQHDAMKRRGNRGPVNPMAQ